MPSRRAPSAPLAAVVVPLLALAAAEPAAGQEWHSFRTARQPAGVEELEIQLLYGAGRLDIGPAEGGFLYDARIRYDAARFTPVRDWRREGDRGRLRLAVSSVPEEGGDGRATVRLDDWDVEFDLEDLPRSGDELGDLELRLDPLVRTRLEIGVGAAETRLDLGGLTLASLEFGTGASATRLSFDAPNRTEMERLSLKSGAAEFQAEGLGNARFQRLEMQGVVGDVVLDFSGAWTRGAEIDIKMAVGKLVMRIPREIGVRIERSGRFASLAAPGFEKTGETYVTTNWDRAEIRLDIQLTTGLGAVQVERR